MKSNAASIGAGPFVSSAGSFMDAAVRCTIHFLYCEIPYSAIGHVSHMQTSWRYSRWSIAYFNQGVSKHLDGVGCGNKVSPFSAAYAICHMRQEVANGSISAMAQGGGIVCWWTNSCKRNRNHHSR